LKTITRPMPTQATLGSFITKNSFEALRDTTRHDTTRHDTTTTVHSSSTTSEVAPPPPKHAVPRPKVASIQRKVKSAAPHGPPFGAPGKAMFVNAKQCNDPCCESPSIAAAVAEAEKFAQSINVLTYTEGHAEEICAVAPLVKEVKVRVALDSAACDNVIDPDELPEDADFEPNETGKHFVGANDSPIERFGSCKTIMSSKHGKIGCTWQMAAVSRALHSVGVVAGPKGGAGKQDILINNNKAYVVAPGIVAKLMEKLIPVAEYDREGNLYVGEVTLSSFHRPGNEE
jgi:hypothetical protein